MNLLHDIPAGKAEEMNVIVEIPKFSKNKYEIDKETGAITLDRVLYSPVHYPTDYGYIPETLSEDGDPLDIMVIGGEPVPPGCVVKARPIGFIKMVDGGEQDNKILAVQKNNPRFDTVKDLSDIELSNPHLLKEIAHFAAVYKELQGKKVEVQGWENAEAAKAEIRRAQEAYGS